MTTSIGRDVPPLDWPDYDIGFTDAVKRVFQKYAVFTGRAGRAEFWWWVLADFIVYAVLYALMMILGVGFGTSDTFGAGGVVFAILLIVWALATIVPHIAVSVRRLHDAGYSGLMYLLVLIPCGIGGIILLVLCAQETSPKAIEYGPPGPAGYSPFGQPAGYGQPVGGYGQAQPYGTSQPFGAPQPFDSPQSFGTPQPYGTPQPFDTPQPFGTAPGYGQPQYGQDTGFGQSQHDAGWQPYAAPAADGVPSSGDGPSSDAIPAPDPAAQFPDQLPPHAPSPNPQFPSPQFQNPQFPDQQPPSPPQS